MATKPSITVTGKIRSSDGTFSTGPSVLIGEPTKDEPPPARINEGVAADYKPPAQYQNWLDNRSDTWLEWVEAGGNTAAETAHIKEADSAGHTAFASAAAGSTASNANAMSVEPNTGTGETGLFCDEAGSGKPASVFETTSNEQPAALMRATAAASGGAGGGDQGVVRIETTSNPPSGGPQALSISANSIQPAALITQNGAGGPCITLQAGPGEDAIATDGGYAINIVGGADDAGQAGGGLIRGAVGDTSAPGALFENSIANGTEPPLKAVSDSNAYALDVDQQSGNQNAARFKAADSGGSNKGAPLVLVPQSFSIGGTPVEDGATWIQTGSYDGGSQFMPRMHLGDTQDIYWTTGPHCYLREKRDTVTGGTDDNWFDVLTSDRDFPTRKIPITAGTTIVKIHGQVSRTSNGADIDANDGASIRVIDVTAATNVIEQTVDLMPKNTGTDENRLGVHFRYEAQYTIPAPGQRTWKVEAHRRIGSVSGSITIRDFVLEVMPKT